MRFNRKILSPGFTALSTALFGVIAGVYYERMSGFSNSALYATALDRSAKSFFSPLKTVDDGLAKRTTKIMQHGFPSFENVKNYQNFVVGFDRRTKNANWVIEYLNETTLTNKSDKLVSREGMEFFSDNTIHPYFRAVSEDFKNSGYDRGHLAAAGNHPLSYEDMSRTFVLSNISPQVGIGFNRGIWNRLETYTRYRAKRSRGVWVCTGPLYLAKKEENGKNYVKYEVIGSNQIAVPTHFFKVLLIESLNGTLELENYVIKNTKINDDTPLNHFQVPLDTIERAAGFLIFDSVPNKNQLKQNQPNKFIADFKFKKRFDNRPKTKELPTEPVAPAA